MPESPDTPLRTDLLPTSGKSQINEGEFLAAVDLGSNSFHMVVARYEHGEPRVIDRLRDSVRMAVGLRPDGTLDATHRASPVFPPCTCVPSRPIPCAAWPRRMPSCPPPKPRWAIRWKSSRAVKKAA